MKRLLTILFLTVCFSSAVFAQTDTQDANNKKLQAAAANGTGLETKSTVNTSVTASAVLIPQIDARRIFGDEIAKNYAVIEVNVGNKSPDAALIIHSVFIDYSRWALRGGGGLGRSMTTNSSQGTFAGYQASTNASHVASEEYRIVRDQLENAQLWSKRSWTMRLVTLAGSLASAYTFSLHEEGIIKGINQITGVFIPGFKEAWPDGTPNQLKAISDYGYRTNKVIPKQSAEIIVCFFPIDRFLTPGLKKLFTKSPALFFAPLQLIEDRKIQKDVAANIEDLAPAPLSLADLRKALPCYMSISRGISENRRPLLDFELCGQQYHFHETDPNGPFSITFNAEGANSLDTAAFRALDFINGISLNSVVVMVDGAMTLDTSSMAAKLEGVKFDSVGDCGDQSPCFWSDLTAGSGVRTGSIFGSYLTGGTVEIAEKDLSVDALTTVPEGSNDQMQNFSFKLTQPIPTGTKLHFKITKPLLGVASLNGTSIESKVLEYVVAGKGPTISDASYLNGTLTIIGKGFQPTMTVKVRPPGGTGADVDLTGKADSPTETKLAFKNLDSKLTTPGCWKIVPSIGGQPVGTANGKESFAVQPKLDSSPAILDGSTIKITGTGLKGLDCSNAALIFTLVDDKGNTFKVDKVTTADDAKSITLNVPSDAKPDAKWKVKVTFNGDDVTNTPLSIKLKSD